MHIRKAALVAIFVLCCITIRAEENAIPNRLIDYDRFLASAAGEYLSANGDTLVVAPVYARMVALDTLYVERTSAYSNRPSSTHRSVTAALLLPGGTLSA